MRSTSGADHKTPTGLGGCLNQRGIDKAFVTGLATDFCVAWTAIDARNVGFETYVVEHACRGIDTNGSLVALAQSSRRGSITLPKLRIALGIQADDEPNRWSVASVRAVEWRLALLAVSRRMRRR